MIKQYMSDTESCPHCGGAVYPSNVRIYHVDNPSESGFLWAYQEKSQDTIEIEYA